MLHISVNTDNASNNYVHVRFGGETSKFFSTVFNILFYHLFTLGCMSMCARLPNKAQLRHAVALVPPPPFCLLSFMAMDCYREIVFFSAQYKVNRQSIQKTVDAKSKNMIPGT